MKWKYHLAVASITFLIVVVMIRIYFEITENLTMSNGILFTSTGPYIKYYPRAPKIPPAPNPDDSSDDDCSCECN